MLDDTTTATANAPAPLTKLDLAALRQADDITFHHMNGVSTIQASRTVRPGHLDPFSEGEASQQRRTIIVRHILRWYDDSRDEGIGIGSAGDYEATFYACAIMSSAKYHPELQTAIRHLREGDDVCLCWTRGGLNTPALRQVGFGGDILRMVVTRMQGKQRISNTYHIDSQVCAFANAYRMIRPYRN